MRFWIKIVSGLAGVWLMAAGAIYWAHQSRPTGDSIAAYLRKTQLPSAGADRSKAILRVEDMLNQVSFEERQGLQRAETFRGFFEALTPEERRGFFFATLPAGFKQMMESFNKMNPTQRKRILERALTDMKKHEGDKPPPNVNAEDMQRIVDEGMHSFYKDANADVKLDMAPLIEQMQHNMQGGFGR